MFNSKARYYPLEAPVETENDYNEKKTTYIAAGTVKMFISLSNESTSNDSDVRINQSTHIGITRDSSIKKDMRVGGKYIVTFVNAAMTDILVYMKEVDNGGCFNG